MQPTIICVTPAAGMIYLNGRFAGEASPQRPLFAPVSPSGALYLEYVPLEGDWGAMARRLVLSGGMPLAEPLADAEGLCCVAWPGGALEVELTPPRRVTEYFTLEGLPCVISRGSSVALSLNGVPVALPAGAGLPRLLRLKDAAALVGETEGGEKYLAALAADLSAQTGLLTADVIEPGDGGLFSAFASLNDLVAHGRLEQWLVDGEGSRRVSSQSAWSAGSPRWPQTAEATVIAAVEAALTGLPGGEGSNFHEHYKEGGSCWQLLVESPWQSEAWRTAFPARCWPHRPVKACELPAAGALSASWSFRHRAESK